MIATMAEKHSIGEESYSAGTRPELTDEPTFCVDPIGAYMRSNSHSTMGLNASLKMEPRISCMDFHSVAFLLA